MTNSALRRLSGLRHGQPRLLCLLLITVGLAVTETAGLEAAHFVSALPLGPQASAPSPFGTFHDLRWVWTFASGPWSTAWMLVALLAFRSVVTAACVYFAWPDDADKDRPSFLVLLRRSALYVPLVLLAMSPWASASFAAGATGYSGFMLGAIFGSAVTAVVLPPLVVTGAWNRLLPWRSMGFVMLVWLELMLAALAITFSPAWVTVLVAAGSGVFNAWAWRQIVFATACVEKPSWQVPALPAVAVVLSGALVVAGGYGVTGSFGSSGHTPPPTSTLGPNGPITAHPVIYVQGFGSSYAGGDVALLGSHFHTVQFSYRGVSSDGTPLPYRKQATYQSLTTSARRLARQVQILHQRSGQRVSVVADSEGTMVARTYFALTASPPVDYFIQSSPLIRPARTYYPPPGSTGDGWIAAKEVRGILSLYRLQSGGFDVHADIPFLRSLVQGAPLYRDQTLCPPPGVKTYAFFPLEGALTVYRGPLARIPWTAEPAYHASLLGSRSVQRDVSAILSGRAVAQRNGWAAAFDVIRGVAGAWQSPALPLRARSAWKAAPDSDPAFGHHACPGSRG